MMFGLRCLLVFVTVAWVPGLAQDGEIYMQPKQRGGYDVQPKQACGGKLIVDNSGTTINSPNYPRNYGNNQKCTWTIKAKNLEDTVEVQCNDFSLASTKNCWGDKMKIREKGRRPEIFCGTGSQFFFSIGRTIKIYFRSNRWYTKKGFSCLVRSLSETTENPASTTTENSASTEGPTTPSGNTGTCTCGVANPSRIVGGQEVNPENKYPWQVGIMNKGGSNYWCGGSIICDQYILSAVHCFINETAGGLVVGVADHNMDSTSDDVSGVTRLVGVEQVIMHPSYSSDTQDFDIALLKLSEKLDLSQHKQLRAVCLPAGDSKTYAGVLATASGWGTLESDGDQPSVLHEVSVPILEPSCWEIGGITERMLCAGLREGGKDTCQGDSGGPLYVQEANKYVQVGITSWGYGCADSNSPGVYARVSKFLPWIKSKTADATCCQ